MTASRPLPQKPIKLYQHPVSGHCHRIRLFLSLLNIPYELVLVDLMKGEHKSEAHLAMNSFGEVPVIDDNGVILSDSNAILVYLSLRYDQSNWLPKDPAGMAHTQRWLSVAAGPLVNGPGLARVSNLFNLSVDKEEITNKSKALLEVMNAELQDRPYLTGGEPTLADLAMYTYTAHAPEGDISLEPYANVQAWLKRIESLPGFVAMERQPIGLFA